MTKWFNDNEAPKGVGKEKDGSISIWFHGECRLDQSQMVSAECVYLAYNYCLLDFLPPGKLGREASAKLLELKPAGSFLVRLSSKMWGYTVTVKSKKTIASYRLSIIYIVLIT